MELIEAAAARILQKGINFKLRHDLNDRFHTLSSKSRYTAAVDKRDDSRMNAPSELKLDEMLKIRLAVMQREHRDLDEAIRALEASLNSDQLMLRRLKKQKLALKEKIVKIEDELIPDIIA